MSATPTNPTATDLARGVFVAYFTGMGLTDERRAQFDFDAILAALAAKGLTIAGPGRNPYPDHGRLDAYANGFNDGMDHFLETEQARETLADVEHTRWANWQQWMHGIGTRNPDGSLTISAEFVDRWDRQIATVYADLSEAEKEADRKEADTSLAALAAKGLTIAGPAETVYLSTREIPSTDEHTHTWIWGGGRMHCRTCKAQLGFVIRAALSGTTESQPAETPE